MEFGEIVKIHHGDDRGFCRHYLLLYSIVLGMETKSAFEFGSGFSTSVILKALDLTGGSLITCDLRKTEDTALSRELTEHKHNWRFIQGHSKDAVKELKDEAFDFVLHDGSHTWQEVAKDIKNILRRMKKNGIILIHDTEAPAHNYHLEKAIRSSLGRYKHDKVTLPYGYGLTIVRIKENFGNGETDIKWQVNRAR